MFWNFVLCLWYIFLGYLKPFYSLISCVAGGFWNRLKHFGIILVMVSISRLKLLHKRHVQCMVHGWTILLAYTFSNTFNLGTYPWSIGNLGCSWKPFEWPSMWLFHIFPGSWFLKTSWKVQSSIYLFKVNNGKTRTMCQGCSKLAIKKRGRR